MTMEQQDTSQLGNLQKACTVLQEQRNQAMNMAVGLQVQLGSLTEENAKLKVEVEELKKQTKKATNGTGRTASRPSVPSAQPPLS